MGSFEVVLDDLQNMANTFANESIRYREITPQLSPPVADSGDGMLNGMLHNAMNMVAVLNEQLAKSIEDHHDKLQAAHGSYLRQEIDNRFLFDNLMKNPE